MTDRELMQQALDMLKQAKDAVADWGAYASEYFQHKHNLQGDIDDIQAQITALSERLAQEPNMPEQYVIFGRFMLQPHPKNGYWLTDTGTSEAMQIFQPEMEQVIKKLWSQF